MSLKMFQEKAPELSPKGISEVKYILAIAAGKGGVGKSTMTVNLALALKKLGYSVGIMDTDIYGPSVRKMLPEETMPFQKQQTIIPAICSGIRMISMAYFRKDNEAQVIRAPIANGLITQFVKQVEWGKLDYLLIDFPPGTGDVQLTICQQANLTGAIVVTTPQEIALLDVRKAMNMFYQVQIPIIGVVENMSFYHHPETGKNLFLFGQGGGLRLAKEEGVPFLGSLPIDPEICHCSDTGKSIFSEDAGSARAFLEIANKVILSVPEVSPPLSIKSMERKNPSTFTIEWSDGQVNIYQLNKIQKRCPCAACTETKEKQIDEQVQAIKIEGVGRYALRFQFSSGCSHGIYNFDLLRQLQNSCAP